MSQAGDNNTSTTMPTVFAATSAEQGSTSAEQVSPTQEALGLLSNAAVQEIPRYPVISSREATVITPRADGKGGVIDISAIRREKYVQQMQEELLNSILPEPVLPVQASPEPEVINIQAQIEARTAEIRQMKRQVTRSSTQSTETVIPEQQPSNKIVEFIRSFLPKTQEPVDLYNKRQQQKAA